VERGNQWTDRSANLAQATGLPGVQEIAFGDMDADGRAELLAFGSGNFAICSLLSTGSWRRIGSGTTAGSGTKAGELLRGGVDLDHNGMPDLWVVQREPAGSFNTRNVHRVLAESGAPAELAIKPLLPQNGRVWRGGQVRFVSWASAVPAGFELGTVTLLLSTNDGAGPYTVLASAVPNSGRAQIEVPVGVSSATCRIVYVLTTPSQGRRRATGPRISVVP